MCQKREKELGFAPTKYHPSFFYITSAQTSILWGLYSLLEAKVKQANLSMYRQLARLTQFKLPQHDILVTTSKKRQAKAEKLLKSLLPNI